MRLDELMRVTPEHAETAASRARRRALSRFDQEPRPQRAAAWKPALALAVLCTLATALITSGGPSRLPAPVEPARDPLRVQMKLSDGTRVEWTFNDTFRL